MSHEKLADREYTIKQLNTAYKTIFISKMTYVEPVPFKICDHEWLLFRKEFLECIIWHGITIIYNLQTSDTLYQAKNWKLFILITYHSLHILCVVGYAAHLLCVTKEEIKTFYTIAAKKKQMKLST